jgi:hypothetical protein
VDTKDRRNQRIAALVGAGINMATVADNFGLSPTTVGKICKKLGVQKKRVGAAKAGLEAARGVTDPKERKRIYNQGYGAVRYASKEYRQRNTEHVRNRYATDPFFRARRIEAVNRYKAKQKAESADAKE